MLPSPPANPAAQALRADAEARADGSAPIWEPGTMPHPFRTAMEARDIDAVVATLHPDVVAYSPVTPQPFVGRYEVAALCKHLIDGFQEFGYTDELTNGRTHVILFRGRVMDRIVTGADVLRLDEHGRIVDLQINGRPPAGVLSVAAHFSPMFARWRRGPVRAAVLRALLRFLPATVERGDALVARIARRRDSAWSFGDAGGDVSR
jgi:SnoaL-like domain